MTKDKAKTRASLKIEIWSDNSLPSDRTEVAEAVARHLDHIKDLCEKGFICGDVVDENFSGWWSVDIQ